MKNPKFKVADVVEYVVPSNSIDAPPQRVELIIKDAHEWMESESCWLYKAISKITHQVVYVRETELTLR
jgi:hypothetical protein